MPEKNPTARTDPLELVFVEPDPAVIRSELVARRGNGTRRIAVLPGGRLAEAVIQKSKSEGMDAFPCSSLDELLALFKGHGDGALRPDLLIVLLHEDPSQLSNALLQLIDLPGGTVIAPITSHYWKRRPLFLISIPKSGTHLVYELASAFGYRQGGNCTDDPAGGTTYFINSMNPHTGTDFLDFRDSSSNLYHPFMRCPAIFSYRNPLDIVVSEANYYHKDGRSAFWSYYSGLDFDGRVRRLINDPFMLGTIRDRILPFLGWLGVKNVIPVSYEELVGARGGGDDGLQTRLIWSLQLKLHVPGSPRDFASRIYNDKSPTFTSGQLNTYKRALSDQALRSFFALPQDFMNELGYLGEDARAIHVYSKRIDEFRRRPLVLSTAAVDEAPILMQANFCSHNIVRFRGRYYAIHLRDGPVRLDAMTQSELGGFPSATGMDSLKQKILLAPGMTPLRLARRLWRAVRQRLRGGRVVP